VDSKRLKISLKKVGEWFYFQLAVKLYLLREPFSRQTVPLRRQPPLAAACLAEKLPLRFLIFARPHFFF